MRINKLIPEIPKLNTSDINLPNPCIKDKCTFFAIILLIMSLLFALVEIELEGKFGWSEQTPTPNIGSSKSSLTLYHLYMAMFMFTAFVAIFFVNGDVTTSNVLYMFAMALWFFTLEDIFWFILNPNYKLPGLKHAWWHNKISNTVPVIYILFPIISTLIANFAGYSDAYTKTIMIILIGVASIIILSPIYHSIYEKTHNEIYKSKNLKEESKH